MYKRFGSIAIAVTFKKKGHFRGPADSSDRQTHHAVVPVWFGPTDVGASEALSRQISGAAEERQDATNFSGGGNSEKSFPYADSSSSILIRSERSKRNRPYGVTWL